MWVVECELHLTKEVWGSTICTAVGGKQCWLPGGHAATPLHIVGAAAPAPNGCTCSCMLTEWRSQCRRRSHTHAGAWRRAPAEREGQCGTLQTRVAAIPDHQQWPVATSQGGMLASAPPPTSLMRIMDSRWRTAMGMPCVTLLSRRSSAYTWGWGARVSGMSGGGQGVGQGGLAHDSLSACLPSPLGVGCNCLPAPIPPSQSCRSRPPAALAGMSAWRT